MSIKIQASSMWPTSSSILMMPKVGRIILVYIHTDIIYITITVQGDSRLGDRFTSLTDVDTQFEGTAHSVHYGL